jgi:hypothetical protein
MVSGVARFVSGQPAADIGVWGEPITLPAAGIPDILHLTNADGSYRLALPPATYTIKVHGTSPSGTDLYGEAAGVVVSSGCDVIADVTVGENTS